MEIAFLTPEWMPFSTLCFTASLGVLCLCFLILWLKAESASKKEQPILEKQEAEPTRDELDEYADFTYEPSEDFVDSRDIEHPIETAIDHQETAALAEMRFDEGEIEDALFGNDDFGGNDFQYVVKQAQILANLNGARIPDKSKTEHYKDGILKAKQHGITRDIDSPNKTSDLLENRD